MIPLPVVSRWFYEVDTMRCFLRIPEDDMNKNLKDCKLDYLQLSSYEYKKTNALLKILNPFKFISDTLQGESFATISMVAPSVFELDEHLNKCLKDCVIVNSGKKTKYLYFYKFLLLIQIIDKKS